MPPSRLPGLNRILPRRSLRACRDEIVRLEEVFSLYSENSALSRLNAHGFLADPPVELTELLDTCRRIFELSNGGFDPTIQPLWRLYAETYGDPRSPRAPETAEIAARRQPHRVRRGVMEPSARDVRPTGHGDDPERNRPRRHHRPDHDGVAARAALRTRSSMSENIAGSAIIPSGRPWQVGIQDPRNADGVVDLVELADQARRDVRGLWRTVRRERAQPHHRPAHRPESRALSERQRAPCERDARRRTVDRVLVHERERDRGRAAAPPAT